MNVGSPPRPDEATGDGDRHTGDLRLRRLFIGELTGPDAAAITRHLDDCPACRARFEGLSAEARAFAQTIAYPRFAGGVARAARVPRVVRPARRNALYAAALGCAAAAALVLVVRPGQMPRPDGDSSTRAGTAPESAGTPAGRNLTKGGDGVAATVRIASHDGSAQRGAAPGSVTRLASGERVRVGTVLPGPRHVMLVSVDDAGVITTLHSEGADSSLMTATTAAGTPTYLPDSLEFTGAGQERLFLFVSPAPFAGAAIQSAVRAAFAQPAATRPAPATAEAKLQAMPAPQLPAEITTFSWLFDKP